MKRTLDIVLIVLFAPLWGPLMAVVALSVRVFLGRPILFWDARCGLHGDPFRLVKFRTMREGPGTDAERLTRFGRFLRATSLDELPELWNVLKGDMSLVGPRPLPVRYLPLYTKKQFRRHDVRPGITGWAQVHGRNALSWDEKFFYDIEYVELCSFAFDFCILMMTVFQFVSLRGLRRGRESAFMPEFKGGPKGIKRWI